MDDPEIETNPYLALRAAKIARNEARLKDLGLWKPPPMSKSRKQGPSSSSSSSVSAPKKQKIVAALVTPRLSTRISGQGNPPKYVEDKIKELRRRTRSAKVSFSEGASNDTIYERKSLTLKDDRGIKKPSKNSLSKGSTPPKANSVRLLALNMTMLVHAFLGTPMPRGGKEFVIQESFRHGHTSKDDFQRLKGVKLSFNKYCGVQQWKNGAFLWVNMGDGCSKSNNTVVNEFLEHGRLVTWFGGSQMVEESPVIKTLIELGKEQAAATTALSSPSLGSGVVLWCRQFDAKSKTFGPYVCLGRLSYHSHVAGSYPVAFTWKLVDYEALIASPECREVFQSIMNA